MTTPTPTAAGGANGEARGGGSERSGNVDTKRRKPTSIDDPALQAAHIISQIILGNRKDSRTYSEIIADCYASILDERDALRAANEAMQEKLNLAQRMADFVRLTLEVGNLSPESPIAVAYRDYAALLPPPAPLAGAGEAVEES